MREFHLEETAVFSTGLRPYPKARRGKIQFYDLYNFKPTQQGLVPYDPLVIPIPENVYYGLGLEDESFPFPQLFVGKKNIFVMGATRIIYFHYSDWSTPITLTTYDAQAPANTKSITAGSRWEFIDFWDTYFFTNGVCTLIGSGQDTMIANGTFKLYVHDGVVINCGTDHKGRVLFGGFSPTAFWDSTWESFWLDWYKKEQDTNINPYRSISGNDVLMPMEENWVWWSSIGGGDAMMLFFPELMKSGFLTSTLGEEKPMILELMKKNEQGFAPMPVQGPVIAMHNFKDSVIVFSEEGVTAMKPVSSPAPTYSIVDLELGGLLVKGAVGGNDKELVYVDASGSLVMIRADLSVEVLGYKEYIFPLIGTDIAVSYSKNTQDNFIGGEYFISNGTKNYHLTASGLCETWQIVTSAAFFQGASIGLGSLEPSSAEGVGRVGIEATDMGLVSGLKTLEWVRVIANERLYNPSDLTSIQVSIDYRYTVKENDTWSSTPYKNVNNEGWVEFPVTALDHRINIKVGDYELADIDSFKTGFKQGDRRFKRSISFDQVKTR